MAHLSSLNTIAEAKSAEYNGKQLSTDKEKSVFDYPDISPGGTLDVSKLRETALLLDKVKKAEEEAVWNASTSQTLLDELEKEKTDNTISANAINTAQKNKKGLLDNAIFNLKANKAVYDQKNPTSPDGKIGGKDKAEWETVKAAIEAKIELHKNKIKELENRKQAIFSSIVSKKNQLDETTEKEKQVRKVVNFIKDERTILDHIINRNRRYLARFVVATNFRKTNLGYDGRSYIDSASAESIAFQIWKAIKKYDENKLWSIINSDTSGYFTNKTDAKAAYDKLKGKKYGWDETKTAKAYVPILWTEVIKNQEEVVVSSPSQFGKLNSEVFEEVDEKLWSDKKKWPYEKPEFRDILIIMKNIFPRGTGNIVKTGNPIFASTDSDIKRVNEEIVNLKYYAFQNLPTSATEFASLVTAGRWMRSEENAPVEIKAKLGNENSGLLKIFWETFIDDAPLNTDDTTTHAVWEHNGSGGVRKTKFKTYSQIETDWFFRNNKLALNAEEVLNYVDQIKYLVENAQEKTDGTIALTGGTTLNIKFDYSWRSVALKVGNLADDSYSALAQEASNVNRPNFTDTEKAMAFAHDTTLVKSVDMVKSYDKFVNEINAEKTKLELEWESAKKRVGDYDEDIIKEQRLMEDTKRGLDSAQKNIEILSGMSLQQLKDAFMKIYLSGPPTTKYFSNEIIDMISHLNEIKNKEANKTLDSTYQGYYNALIKLQKDIHDADKENLIQVWETTDPEKGLPDEKLVKFSSYKTDSDKKAFLNKIKSAYEKIENLRKLQGSETNYKNDIIAYLGGKRKDEPTSDLTVAELKNIFHTATLSDSDINESTWKGTTNFNTKDKLIALIGDYYKGSGKPEEGTFKEHLTGHIKLSGVDGDDYWEKLIKKGPEFVIGAIRQYEYQHGKGKYATQSEKDAVNTAVDNANSDEEAKKLKVIIEEKWDKKNPQDMVTFLYKKEIGKTGIDLIKKSKAIVDEPKDSGGDGKDKGVLAHLKKHWIPYSAVGIVIAAAIGAAIYFWEDIKGWFGTSEENTDKVEENE
ncbi:MAG: hypothetical protein I3273_02930 [Candidatus Moeniiplasma glomeromycotorum]|nr:hypothetical protein [Candidatus Moeniiplasma glomeromycotorum]MCE8167589.1 hypothetical protein [Candidatus Moeniiplasma glomeromycotorum]MCE8169060.1 hypothetical protein [Candidatus Moeniiplasma glomeromycotorum]